MPVEVGVERAPMPRSTRVQIDDRVAALSVTSGVRPLVASWSVREHRGTAILGLRAAVVRGAAGSYRAAAVAAALRAGLRLYGPAVNLGAAGVCGRRLWMPVLAGWRIDDLRRWLTQCWGAR